MPLCVARTLQSALETGQEGIIVQIDFVADFQRVLHQGIFLPLCCVGVKWFLAVCSDTVLIPSDTVCSVCSDNRSQYVQVDGCRNKLVNVVSGVSRGSVLVSKLFLLYTEKLFSVVGNKIHGYADDSTLVTVVPSISETITVTESLNNDLSRVIMWCDLWGMKLNASKTKTIMISKSRTIHPQSTTLTLDGRVLKESVLKEY